MNGFLFNLLNDGFMFTWQNIKTILFYVAILYTVVTNVRSRISILSQGSPKEKRSAIFTKIYLILGVAFIIAILVFELFDFNLRVDGYYMGVVNAVESKL